VKLPFVRVGAMVACRGCGHRFQVQSEHVRRLAAVPADTGLDSDNPLLLGFACERPPSPPQAAPVIRSPREVVAERTPTPELDEPRSPQPTLRPIQPVLKHEAPSEDVAKVIAMHRAQRGRARRIIWLLVLAVILVSTVVALLIAKNRAADQDGGEKVGGKGSDGKAQVRAVRLEATRMSAAGWQDVHETMGPEKAASSVRLVKGRLIGGSSGHSTYRAELEVDGDGFVELATLHLMLLDEADRVFARNGVPLMLLSADQLRRSERHPVTVVVPRRLANRAAQVESWVQVHRVVEPADGRILARLLWTSSTSPIGAELNIAANNPLNATMQRAIFFIRAFNRRHETVGRWRVDWRKRIGPGQRIEFTALIDSHDIPEIDAWEVVAAGTILP